MPDESKECDDSYSLDDFTSCSRLESICEERREEGRKPRPSLQRGLGRRSLVELVELVDPPPSKDDDSYSLDFTASHCGGEKPTSQVASIGESSDEGSYSVDDFSGVTKQSRTGVAPSLAPDSRSRPPSSFPARPPPPDAPSPDDCSESSDEPYSVDDFSAMASQPSKHEAASLHPVAPSHPAEETKEDFDDDASSEPSPLHAAHSNEECKEDVEMDVDDNSTDSVCSASSDHPMREEPIPSWPIGGIDRVTSGDGPESAAGLEPPMESEPIKSAQCDSSRLDEGAASCADASAMQLEPTDNGQQLQRPQAVAEAPPSEKVSPSPPSKAEGDEDEYEYIGLVEQPDALRRRDSQTQTQLDNRPVKSPPRPKTPKRVPASFVPRCAHAKTRRSKSIIEEQPEKPAKVRRYSKRRLEQLAKPVQHHIHGKENNLPETTPGTASKKKVLDKEDTEDFLERMEEKEAERQDKLARAAAETQYNAGSDKKRCPSCGTVQSYDEMVGGSNICREDACRKAKRSYEPRKRFVLKDFEERQLRSSQRRSSTVERIHEERRSSIVSTSQRRSRRQKELIEKISTEDFNSRMAKDIEARRSKINNIQSQRMDQLNNDYTFKPKLNVPEHLIRNRKGGWDSLSAPLRRYTEEYQPPPSRRKKKKAKKSRKPLASPWESQPKRKVDEQRMKSRFQRAIM